MKEHDAEPSKGNYTAANPESKEGGGNETITA